MKRILLLIMTIIVLASTGCSSRGGSAAGGAIGGAAGGIGAYEYRMREEMRRIEDDYRAGKMDKREYEIRIDQIQRMSLLR